MVRNGFIKLSFFYLISVGFILLNLWFVVKKDLLFVSLLPIVFLGLLVVVFSFDKLVNLVVFFAPLSLPLHEIMPGFGFDMYLPTEPVLFSLFIIFLIKVLHERKFDRDILLHPVSLAVFVYLLWLAITSMTSTMPVVSVKFLFIRV